MAGRKRAEESLQENVTEQGLEGWDVTFSRLTRPNYQSPRA